MLKSVLEDLERSVEGTIAVSLMGLDGIAIESVKKTDFPLDSIGAEMSSLLRTLQAARTDLDTGELEQFALTTGKYVTLLSRVIADYFILMILSPEGNYGRAKFELRRARRALQSELT